MKARRKRSDPRFNASPKTRRYTPVAHLWYAQPRDLPPFNFATVKLMLLDPTCRLALAIRQGFVQMARIAHRVNREWVDGVVASSPEVAKYVEATYKRLWAVAIPKLCRAQAWGWAAAEVTGKVNRATGLVEVDEVFDRHAFDSRVIVNDGRPAGVRFLRCRGADGQGWVDLKFPHCLWHSYFPEAGYYYGLSHLFGMYSPWADCWLNGGALDVRRLFMHRDAYGGADMTYPEGTIDIDGKGEVPCVDVARQIVEQMQSGSVTTRPSTTDENGKPLWELTRAVVPANPAHILQYPKDLRGEMLQGALIPEDVLSADAAGSWEGKKVPMTMFLSGLDLWIMELIVALDRVVRPYVLMNFGPDAWYSVEAVPLVEQIMTPTPEQGKTGPKPEGMGGGADAPAGEKPVKISMAMKRAVRAAQRVFMSSGGPRRAPKGGVVLRGVEYKGGEFIPEEVLSKLTDQEHKALDRLDRQKNVPESTKELDDLPRAPKPMTPEEKKKANADLFNRFPSRHAKEKVADAVGDLKRRDIDAKQIDPTTVEVGDGRVTVKFNHTTGAATVNVDGKSIREEPFHTGTAVGFAVKKLYDDPNSPLNTKKTSAPTPAKQSTPTTKKADQSRVQTVSNLKDRGFDAKKVDATTISVGDGRVTVKLHPTSGDATVLVDGKPIRDETFKTAHATGSAVKKLYDDPDSPLKKKRMSREVHRAEDAVRARRRAAPLHPAAREGAGGRGQAARRVGARVGRQARLAGVRD